jgi:biopolymer transport protein ExbB
MAALEQGGAMAWGVFITLVIMSAASWYVMFVKVIEQQKVLNQAKRARTTFWGNPTLKDGAAKLEKNSAFRQLVDDGLRAQEQHGKLLDQIDQSEWIASSLNRSQAAINAKLATGLALLATVGSVAPFVGLYGTVIGIYRALIKIGAAGQASIDAVAGPVGEALIMTALGLAAAVPAVIFYNWLVRRNKVVAEQIASFTTDLHGYMVSGGALKPQIAGRSAPAASLKAGSSTAAPKA